MRRLLSLLSVVMMLIASVVAAADSNITILTDSLRKDSSFKVRAKAAEVLAKKGDASAIPALIEALQKDESEVVRAAAAAALGTLGPSFNSTDAKSALKTASEKDASSLVKTEAKKAFDKFPAAGSSGGYMVDEVYVQLGKFTNNTKINDPALITRFETLLDKQLASTGKKVSAPPSGKKPLTLDGSIKKLESTSKGEITLEISVIVTREKAFLGSISQNASIDYGGKLSAAEEQSGRQELMDALVPAAYGDLKPKIKGWK